MAHALEYAQRRLALRVHRGHRQEKSLFEQVLACEHRMLHAVGKHHPRRMSGQRYPRARTSLLALVVELREIVQV